MNSKMMAAGIALVFVAMALPSNAYHIVDTHAPPVLTDQTGFNPVEWGAQIGVSQNVNYPVADPFTNDQEPCATLNNMQPLGPEVDAVIDTLCTDAPAWDQSDVLFGGVGFVACEVNPEAPDPGNSGAGGLCFMNPGFQNGASGCEFGGSRRGNSNGMYDPYNGAANCNTADTPQPVIQDVSRQWYEITMQSVHPTDYGTNGVEFVGQIAGDDCGDAGSVFVYDNQYAYTVDSGHVAGFPTTQPVAGTFGGYWVKAYTAFADPSADTTLTPCNPYPFYWG